MVRAAVLKMKDPKQIIQDMEKLDEMEFNPVQQPQLNEKVLKDKCKKLHEAFEHILRLYEKENPDIYKELRKLEVEYEQKAQQSQYFDAVKNAQHRGTWWQHEKQPSISKSGYGSSSGDSVQSPVLGFGAVASVIHVPAPFSEPATEALLLPRNHRSACVLRGVKESKGAPGKTRSAASGTLSFSGVCAPKTRPRIIFPGVVRVS
ncbi:PREDICTED: uncharacterized protein LOC101378265 [Odobenus rosmarus divergens]|uniref:Uncharacterized protein LOC101378265 n=1 Tax=Odobenus rosmarus divergens TaxID=9708 RepID=A0A9B0GLP0_ODORO